MYKKEITLLTLLFLILCCFMFGPISNIVMDTYEKYSIKLNEPNNNNDTNYYENLNNTNENNITTEVEKETDQNKEDEQLLSDEQKENEKDKSTNSTTNTNNSLANNTTNTNTPNKKPTTNTGNNTNTNNNSNSSNTGNNGNTSSGNNQGNKENENEENTTPQYSMTTPVNNLSISILPGDNINITSNGISYTLTGEMAAREKIPTFSTTSYLDLRVYSPKSLNTEEYQNMKVTLLTYVNGKTYTHKDHNLLRGLGTNNVYFELTQQFMYGQKISIIIDWGDGEEMTYTFTFNVNVQ